MEGENSFELQSILSFIEETPAPPLNVADEKDLSNIIDRVLEDLSKNDDWQRRIQALITLQALCNGNLESLPNAVSILRRLLDPVSSTALFLKINIDLTL